MLMVSHRPRQSGQNGFLERSYPQFTGGVVFAVNLNIERIVAQGSELLAGEFKNSPDLSSVDASISST